MAFKIGDRVEVTDPRYTANYNIPVGTKGTIQELYSNDLSDPIWRVLWDTKIEKYLACESRFKLYEPDKIGDRIVRVVLILTTSF